MDDLKQVIIFTDGACLGNPGPGGYGVILIYGDQRKKFSGGFRLTTNNRMELLAAIKGLQLLKEKCRVTLYSDSQYLVMSMTEGWVLRWRTKRWTHKGGKIPNTDLWQQLLELCGQHEVTFEWVQGHTGQPENELCDKLSITATQQADLPPDEAYEAEVKRQKRQGSLF